MGLSLLTTTAHLNLINHNSNHATHQFVSTKQLLYCLKGKIEKISITIGYHYVEDRQKLH